MIAHLTIPALLLAPVSPQTAGAVLDKVPFYDSAEMLAADLDPDLGYGNATPGPADPSRSHLRPRVLT